MVTLQHLTDAELLNLLKLDDRDAFTELYERHWLSLYSIAYRRLRDKETCRDIIHDIYADLWDKRHQRNILVLLPYLHTTVRNKIFTLLSKGKATAHFIEPFENMAVSSLTADGRFEELQLRKLMLLWIDTLPAKRREIFRLRFLEERSTSEISDQLQISRKTVQNQLLLSINNFKTIITHLFTLFILLLNPWSW